MKKKLKQLFAAFAITALCITSVKLAPTSTTQAASSVIKLNHTKKTMSVGDSLKLKATVTKKNLKTKKLVWKSNKASIASVTQKGVVKAKQEGKAKITVTIKGTSYKATCSVNIQDIENADDEILFTVKTTVRIVGDADKTWKKEVDAKEGDKVEFQIEYKNTDTVQHDRVVIGDILPDNLRYVPGSTIIYSGLHPNGAVAEKDDIMGTGLIIGNYKPGANAFVRITAEVVDDNFSCGKFILHNWGRASVGESIVQDSAAVNVELSDCPDSVVEPEKSVTTDEKS